MSGPALPHQRPLAGVAGQEGAWSEMARAIWTGSLAFGLVDIPVRLHAATEDHTIGFHQFEAGTADRIRYKRVNERTGRDVDLADIVRGHEVSKGDYVLVTDEELQAVEPAPTGAIEISDFVDLAGIDPLHFDKAYYLGPQTEGAGRAYALLHRAMADTGKERKRRGEQIITEGERAEEPNIIDLTEALRRSMELTRRGRPGASAGTRGRRRTHGSRSRPGSA